MLRVEIPGLPPKECSPNWRGHWATKARAVKKARQDAFYCAKAAKADGQARFLTATLRVTIYVKSNRYVKDTDNATASLKPFIDGCVDASIVPDDNPNCLTLGIVVYVIDKDKAPLTVLEFVGV